VPQLIAAAVFVAVTSMILWSHFREQERAGFGTERIERAMGKGAPLDFGMPAGVELRGSRISNSRTLSQFLSGISLTYSIESRLNRSDWQGLKVSDFLLMSVVTGVVPFSLVVILTGSIWIGAAVGLLGLFTPRYLLSRSVKKRRNRFNNQMVDVLAQMANSLKAGFGLLQAMSQAAQESKDPISSEFKKTIRDIQVGASVEDAFNNLDARVGSEDLGIVITAVLIQRSAGGSLAEIIEGVAHTMRERIRIRGEINTLTTQGKYTGYLIGSLPIFLAGGFFIVNRSYESLLFTTSIGHILLGGWAVMQGIGLLVIRKILNIEI
jgi:tight adherence protein B